MRPCGDKTDNTNNNKQDEWHRVVNNFQMRRMLNKLSLINFPDITCFNFHRQTTILRVLAAYFGADNVWTLKYLESRRN